MSTAPKLFSELLDPDALSRAPLREARGEARRDEVRIVEYAPFPRVSADQRMRLGFTRDVAASGMCLGVDEPENLGSLLRVDVRELDGRSSGSSIARVVWSTTARDGRHWLGLELLCETAGDAGARPRLVSDWNA